jgi:DNA-binding response OmpR family regulator
VWQEISVDDFFAGRSGGPVLTKARCGTVVPAGSSRPAMGPGLQKAYNGLESGRAVTGNGGAKRVWAHDGARRMKPEPVTLAVVDDETDIRETVSEYLEHNGFKVVTADSAAAFRRILEGSKVDLALLDVNMPGQNGLSLARYLRENLDIGIIMLTAAADTDDRIAGLELGADDYLGKPFDLRELLARVRSVLRRRSAKYSKTSTTVPGRDQRPFGKFVLDLEARQLRDSQGESVPLTAMEFDLLRAFAMHPLKVLSREQLLDLAHNRDEEPFERSIDIRIARLRRKIESDPAKPQVIKTVRGAGYIFVPDA